MLAAWNGHTEVVDILIKAGADIHALDKVSENIVEDIIIIILLVKMLLLLLLMIGDCEWATLSTISSYCGY